MEPFGVRARSTIPSPTLRDTAAKDGAPAPARAACVSGEDYGFVGTDLAGSPQ